MNKRTKKKAQKKGCQHELIYPKIILMPQTNPLIDTKAIEDTLKMVKNDDVVEGICNDTNSTKVCGKGRDI